MTILQFCDIIFIDRTFNCNHTHALAIWKYILKNDNCVTNFHFEISADLLNEEEKKGMIFSELYTRAQALIRALFSCEMKCKILNSNELVELLYIAYNRDESEIYTPLM